MSLLATALMIPHNPEFISLTGFVANLIPVTLGNIVGGALMIGAGYWFASETGEAGEEG
jgi:nitrite transporter NirC